MDKTRSDAGLSRWTRISLARVMQLIIPVVLFSLIVYTVGTGEILGRMREVAPAWVAAALLVAQAQIALSALRWQLTARRIGVAFSFRRALSEYYLSGVINMTLPGGVLGDGVRAVRSQETKGLETAAHAVVIERLAGQVALVAILSVGLLLSGRSTLQVIGGLLLGFIVVSIFIFPRLTKSVLRRLAPSFIERFIVSVKKAWCGRRNAATQVLLSFLIVMANLASFALVAAATGVHLGMPEVLYTVPLILLAMLLPFSVAGWGYREGAAAAVFPLVGATAAEGVGASIVFGAVILLANLPGLLVFKSRQGGVRKLSSTDLSGGQK